MTMQDTLRVRTKQARIVAIEKQLLDAAAAGLYEIRIEKLLPEQVEYLKENGITYREVMQKMGTMYDITWE